MEHSPNSFNDLVLGSRRPLAMPLAVYPGLALTGAKVHDIVTNPQAQCEAQLALHERYHTPFVLSAMDLSVEAEAFGCTIQPSVTEIPSVIGRLVTNLAQAEKLAAPPSISKRCAACAGCRTGRWCWAAASGRFRWRRGSSASPRRWR